MTNRITVAEMIAILQTMPQDLPMEMGMNWEYQSGITKDMIEVFEDRHGDRFVYITDTPGCGINEDEV